MGSVAMGPQHNDRYLVLFPSTLLILSVSHRLSAFIYEVNFKMFFYVIIFVTFSLLCTGKITINRDNSNEARRQRTVQKCI